MNLRAKYVLLYIANLILPLIIFLAGATFIYSGPAKDKGISITSLYLLCFLLFLIGGFLVNYWYGQKLGIPVAIRIVTGVLSALGFFYLMGFNQQLISATNIIKESWELYVKNWKMLLKYSTLFLIPTLAMALTPFLLTLLQYLQTAAWLSMLLLLIIIAAMMIVTLWLSIGLAKILKNLIDNQPNQTFKETIKNSSNLIWPVVYTSLLSALIILGGTLLFILPGVIFSIWYVFTFYAVIFDGEKGPNGLRASKNLVTGRWFAILWRIAVLACVFALGVMAVNSILQLPLVFISNTTVFDLANLLLSNIVNVLLMPLTAAASLILYLHAKKIS